MRYELFLEPNEFASLCRNIPNNAYVYCDDLSSLHCALFKVVGNQLLQMDIGSKTSTNNTAMKRMFNMYPDEEYYLVDLRTKAFNYSCIEKKMDINQCNVELKLDVCVNMKIKDPVSYLIDYEDYSIYSIREGIKNIISEVFNEVVFDSNMDGRELIQGNGLTNLKRKLKYELDDALRYHSLDIYLQSISLRVNNYHEVSNFVDHDRLFIQTTKEQTITRLLDTVFMKYGNTEPISNNQTEILKTYFNNAIIQSEQFQVEEFASQFLASQNNTSFVDLVNTLDAINQRMLKPALENKYEKD